MAIAIALLQISLQALAAEADASPGAQLETVTVTGDWLGSPSETKVLEHPGARTIIERKQIEESGSTSVRDVLRQIPGVQVQESNGTGGSDISLNVGVRGLTSRLSPRSTILLDGVPLAYAPYGQPQLSLAPLSLGSLEAVDVVRGAGSVRYGPQNVGGIINFVTRSIPRQFTADASIGVESASHGGGVKTTPSLFVGGTNEQGLGLALLYSGTHGDGYRSSNDSTRIDDVMLKGAYRFSKYDDIALSLHHFEGSGRMPGGLTTAQYAANPSSPTAPSTNSPGAGPTARSSTRTTTASTSSSCSATTPTPSAAATSSRTAPAPAPACAASPRPRATTTPSRSSPATRGSSIPAAWSRKSASATAT